MGNRITQPRFKGVFKASILDEVLAQKTQAENKNNKALVNRLRQGAA